MKEEYPLEELFTIKIRRFETAIKVLEEKKRLYLKEVKLGKSKIELSEDEAKQQAKFDLHAYIRRQQTYFKKNKDIKWLNNVESN